MRKSSIPGEDLLESGFIQIQNGNLAYLPDLIGVKIYKTLGRESPMKLEVE
jgi:hypothetical protein